MIQDNLQCNIPTWNTPVIPGNATQGSILITKTDFTTPPNSQELFKWEKMEDLIGVANVKIEFDNIEEPTQATLYKAKGHKDASGNWSYDWESVGTWGMIKAENATKINLIDFVNYTIIVNENTAKLIGTKADGTTEEIGDAILFFGKEEGEELKTQVENLKLDNEGIKNLIAVINLDIDKILENQDKFLTIYNKLIEATSPNLVLSKASDGINLEWVNKLGIDNITCDVNATNSTITIYKIINGVEEELITLDKFDLNSFNNLYDLVNEINRAIGELTATVATYDNKITKNESDIILLNNKIETKQDILMAGDNINIEDNVISASGSGFDLALIGDIDMVYINPLSANEILYNFGGSYQEIKIDKYYYLKIKLREHNEYFFKEVFSKNIPLKLIRTDYNEETDTENNYIINENIIDINFNNICTTKSEQNAYHLYANGDKIINGYDLRYILYELSNNMDCHLSLTNIKLYDNVYLSDINGASSQSAFHIEIYEII